jgi:putative SOS response-associated peptidase YedK
MCGRFTLRTPARDMVEIFELLREPELTPRFNIAPTQQVAVVR